MKMSKVGNQTNSQDPQAVNSRIFVGNLNTFQCSKTDVERMFQRYGRLAGKSNSENKNPKKLGRVSPRHVIYQKKKKKKKRRLSPDPCNGVGNKTHDEYECNEEL